MESDEALDQAPAEAEASAEPGQNPGQNLTQEGDQASVAGEPEPAAEAEAEVPAAPAESAQALAEGAAPSSATDATAQAVSAPAESAESAAEPFAAFLAMIRRLLDRRKVSANVGVHVVRQDPDGRGGLLAFHARSMAEAREAAGAALYSGDGREWKHVGSGPDLDSDRFHCYVHVSPLG